MAPSLLWTSFSQAGKMRIFFEQEGRLEQTFVAGTLKSLFDHSETGMLTLEQNGIKKSVFLNQGKIVFATSNWKNDWLGIFLFQSGKLTYEEFERSSKLMAPNRRHGEILVELGIITTQTLNWAVKEQVREIVMSLFQWERGSYSFISMEPLENETITLKTKTLDLIFEGTRRVNNWGIIQSQIGSLETSYQFCQDKSSLVKELYLKPKDKKVLEMLHDPSPVREICRSLSMNDFIVCRILMGLQAVGLIELVTKPARVH
jgi:hypothetical protein